MEWELDQMDVATAFLYAKLEEETYVDITEGVAPVGGDNRVWRLKKCLYCVKQSPRMWNMTIDVVLHDMGFERFVTEHGMQRERGVIKSSWHCMSTTCLSSGTSRSLWRSLRRG